MDQSTLDEMKQVRHSTAAYGRASPPALLLSLLFNLLTSTLRFVFLVPLPRLQPPLFALRFGRCDVAAWFGVDGRLKAGRGSPVGLAGSGAPSVFGSLLYPLRPPPS